MIENNLLTINLMDVDAATTPLDLADPTVSMAVAATTSSTVVDAGSLEPIDGVIDLSLAQAAISAVQSGSLTPLIKEELKCSIQAKRLSHGKDELQVDVHSTPAPEQVGITMEIAFVKLKRFFVTYQNGQAHLVI